MASHDHKRLDRLLQVREHDAGMAQQGKLHGEAKPAGVAATLGHEVPVGSGQGEKSRQAVRIVRYPEERLALFVGQQAVGAPSLSSGG